MTLIYLNVPEFTLIYPNCVTEFTWIYPTLPECNWIYLNLPDFTGIYLNIPKFTGIYLNIPKFTWVYLNLPEFPWPYLNLHEFPCIYLNLPEFSIWVHLGSLGITLVHLGLSSLISHLQEIGVFRLIFWEWRRRTDKQRISPMYILSDLTRIIRERW